MLFLEDSIDQSRSRLLRDFERGKISGEQAFRQILDLDPDDHIAMTELGRLRREAGDRAGAEEFFWRAA